MIYLKQQQKIDHHKELGKFVEKVNSLLNPYGTIYELKQVCFIIPLDNDLLYIDYPYASAVDTFNEKLNSNDRLKTINEIIFKKHHQFTPGKDESVGYVYYLYDNNKKGKYQIRDYDSNIGFTKNEQITLLSYLPIIHCSTYPDIEDYETENITVDKKLNNADYGLLSICKKTTIENEDKFTIVCTFNIIDLSISKNEIRKQVNELNDKVVYFLETYFDSPIVKKIFDEKRKSEILAYQHSYNQLNLIDQITYLNELVNKGDKKSSKKVFEVARKKINVWYMLSEVMFKMEQLETDKIGVSDLPYLKKTAVDTIKAFIKDLHYFNITVDLNIDPKIVETKIPKGKELYDRLIVLWNIYHNACSKAQAFGAKRITISAIVGKNNRLKLIFLNEPEMPTEYVSFIKGKSDYVHSKNTARYIRPYKGLEIVKDKAELYLWTIDVNIANLNSKNQTEFSIQF